MRKVTLFLRVVSLCAITGLFLANPAWTLDFDFQGTFTKDNDVVLLDFSVGANSTITIFSSSWLYGNPPAGQGLGGFDPILAVWDSSGNLVSQQDDGHNTGSTLSNGVSYSHGTWDSFFDVFLTVGDYTASIAQYDNFAAGTSLANGFARDSNPNYTFDNGWGGATQPYFNGVWDNNDPRTGNWQFHILNVASAQQQNIVPEPTTLLLLGPGLVGMAAWRKRQVKKHS